MCSTQGHLHIYILQLHTLSLQKNLQVVYTNLQVLLLGNFSVSIRDSPGRNGEISTNKKDQNTKMCEMWPCEVINFVYIGICKTL